MNRTESRSMTDPAFSLVPSNRVEVNRGESTRLTLYFVGAGNVEKTHLLFFIHIQNC